MPIWSPGGPSTAFVSSRGNTGLAFGSWVIEPDGGSLRQPAARGLGWTRLSAALCVYSVDAGVLYDIPADG